MSLFIEVYVGSKDRRKLVAKSVAHNVSNLADVSNYVFDSHEFGEERLDIPEIKKSGEIKDHYRNQSVWSLVRKIAERSYGKT